MTVQGARLATRCGGDKKAPSVLLVAGFDTAIDDAWGDVQAQIGDFSRVCATTVAASGAVTHRPARRPSPTWRPTWTV